MEKTYNLLQGVSTLTSLQVGETADIFEQHNMF